MLAGSWRGWAAAPGGRPCPHLPRPSHERPPMRPRVRGGTGPPPADARARPRRPRVRYEWSSALTSSRRDWAAASGRAGLSTRPRARTRGRLRAHEFAAGLGRRTVSSRAWAPRPSHPARAVAYAPKSSRRGWAARPGSIRAALAPPRAAVCVLAGRGGVWAPPVVGLAWVLRLRPCGVPWSGGCPRVGSRPGVRIAAPVRVCPGRAGRGERSRVRLSGCLVWVLVGVFTRTAGLAGFCVLTARVRVRVRSGGACGWFVLVRWRVSFVVTGWSCRGWWG